MKRVLLIVLSCLFLSACSKPSVPNLQALSLPKTPNYYLVCPPKYCNVAANETSPIYPASAGDLFNAFNQVVSEQPRTRFIYSIPEQGTYVLEVRTPFGLPSMITVQFIAVSDTSSTLAIYSQSYYGVYDFGMNKHYVKTWLNGLNKLYGMNPV